LFRVDEDEYGEMQRSKFKTTMSLKDVRNFIWKANSENIKESTVRHKSEEGEARKNEKLPASGTFVGRARRDRQELHRYRKGKTTFSS
jgi:hypothetical protein